MRTTIHVTTFMMLLSIALASAGGFGEYAGILTFNTLSGMNTQTWTLVNTYNHSIQFSITKPAIEGVTITTSPANGGTIPANSAFPVEVTVSGVTTSSINPTTAYITAQVVNGGSSNSSTITLATSKKMVMYLEQTTITITSVTTSTSTSTSIVTTVVQNPLQSGNANQSTTLPTTIQNNNSSVQGAGQGSVNTAPSALAVTGVALYLLVAVVLLLVVICALLYHIARKNKPETKTSRRNKQSRGKK
jgi:hypothetical protein